MEGPLCQGGLPFTSRPTSTPREDRSSYSLRVGAGCGPAPDPRQQAPSRSEPAAQCYLPSPSYDLPLSRAPEKEWNLNIETLFWPKQSFHSLGSMMGLFPPVNGSRNLQLLPLLLRVINWISLLFSLHTPLSVTRLRFTRVDGFSFFLFHGVLIFKADGVRPCPLQ